MTSMPYLLYGFKEHFFALPLFVNLKVCYSPFFSLSIVFVIKLPGGMLLVILHLLTISNTQFTQISDVHSKFLPYISSLNDADYLFVCFYKMAIRRQLLAKGSATMNIPGQVALFPPRPGAGCRNNNMRRQLIKSIAN